MLNSGQRPYLWTLAPIAIIILSLSLIFAGQAWLASSDDDYDDLYHYTDVWPEEFEWGTRRPTGPVFDGIDKLHGLGVFEGTECGNEKFCPDDPVDRKTLAVWMVRVLDGDDAPDFVGVGQGFETRFDDIANNYPEGPLIERLAELGITYGCSNSPAQYCPEGTVSRAQLATFIVRALNLPESEHIGFWDVDKNNKHLDNIDRLVGSEIDDGCSEFRFTPLEFCPDDLVSRGELVKFLSEVVDYIEAWEVIEINGSISASAINLVVDYDEESGITEITWNNPTGSNDISGYVLQWQPTWTGFNYQRYRVVDFNQSGNYRLEFNLPIAGEEIYSVRVIVVYGNGDRLATDEVKIISGAHRLRDLIQKQVIDTYGGNKPWMLDAWRHLNGMDTNVFNGRENSVSFTGSYRNRSGLDQVIADNFSISTEGLGALWDFEDATATVVHELGHVYTITSGVTKNQAPNAIGFLYLDILSSKHEAAGKNTRWCEASELYADLAQMAFAGSYSDFDPRLGVPVSVSLEKYEGHAFMTYWSVCRFDLDQATSDRIAKEVVDITKSVFADRKMPQWFYDTYQLTDRSIDLDKLWSDIHSTTGRTRSLIIYGLKDEFGGYCSEAKEKILQSQLRSVVPLPKDTPWRDAGGCPRGGEDVSIYAKPPQEQTPQETDSSGNNEDSTMDCTGSTPIVVASDEASQSDRYSAATLAGVLGTDCIILAGPRNGPMPADEISRLESAKFPGYIVGGTAAVPASKVSGYNLKRLSGSDRWHTARMVGAEAVIVAGGSDNGSVEASAGAEDPTTDCTGNIPIVVASDEASQSDRYSAATLAGVLGTDCIILAGGRNESMPADQISRLNTAASSGYIVGGTAAVPASKVSGYDLKRLSGNDRWHTARLVGAEAVDIAS